MDCYQRAAKRIVERLRASAGPRYRAELLDEIAEMIREDVEAPPAYEDPPTIDAECTIETDDQLNVACGEMAHMAAVSKLVDSWIEDRIIGLVIRSLCVT